MHTDPPTSSDELPTIVHITHWKAGSQWLYHILHQCCPDRIVSPEDDGIHFLNKPVLTGKIYPTVYLPRQVVESVKVPQNSHFFVVLRDPRDTLVSLYFSHKVSHILERNVTQDFRQQLKILSEEDGLLELIAGPRMQDVLDIHTSWIDSGATIFSYESLIEHDEELLVPFFTKICPLGVPEIVLRSVIQMNRFEKLSGRARGVEDTQSHMRSGQPGDWKKHFSPRVAAAFEKRFGDKLLQLKYVHDGSWIEEIKPRLAPSPKSMPTITGLRSFSVILTLPQHRGHGIAAVQSWTQSMGYPSGCFELIVVSDGSSPELDKEIRTHLRPNDQILIVLGANRSALLNRGARAAAHEHLVFTEAHVEAEPDFLRELYMWLSIHPEMDAVCCRTIATFENNLAYWDGKLYDEVFANQRNGNEWWNINIHSFSMTRECFRLGGGLDESYDLFSVMLLAAKLRGLGMKIGYAGAPAVLHHYRTTLQEVEQQTRSFVRDEYRFRQTQPGPDRLGFSSLPSMPDTVSYNSPWPDLLPSAWEHLGLKNMGLFIRLMQSVILNFPLTHAWRKNRTIRQLAWSKFGCIVWSQNRARLEHHYRHFRQLVAVDELISLSAVSINKIEPPLDINPGDSVAIANAGGAVSGLHANEIYKTVLFRWTEPMSAWRFVNLKQNNTILLDLLSLREDIHLSHIQVYWNGARLARDTIIYTLDSLAISIPDNPLGPDISTLVIIVPKMKCDRAGCPIDSRSLGLAVIRVRTSSSHPL